MVCSGKRTWSLHIRAALKTKAVWWPCGGAHTSGERAESRGELNLPSAARLGILDPSKDGSAVGTS